MPDKHAVLSASSSERWINCPPSARLCERVDDKPSSYAAEGTVAHAKAEEKLRNWKEGHPRKRVKCPNGEMDEATTDYRDYVIEIFNAEKKKCNITDLYIEVQLDLNKWIAEGFGTSDAVVVSDNCLHVIDFKYGAGVPVSAEHNSQLMLYAAGAMDMYECLYDFDTIMLHIFQPRMGNISEWELTTEELNKWLEEVVRPQAILAWNGQGEHNPGAWCRFCKVSATCKARAKANMAVAAEDKRLDGMLLSDKEIATLLPQLPEIQKWCKDLQDYALQEAMNGTAYDGYKVVEGRSLRKIADERTALQKLEDAGYQREAVTVTKLNTITNLEKLLGKKQFTEIMGDTVYKPPGAPTLVPESDKRPPIKEALAMEAWGDELGDK